MYDKYGNIK